MGPKPLAKELSSHKSRTLASIFTNRPHFLKNDEENLIKSWNLKKCLDFGAWALETAFGPIGPTRLYPAIYPEPWLQYSQIEPHFNGETNPIKLWNLKTFLNLGAWGFEATFGPMGLQDVPSHKSRTLAPIFTNRTSFSQESWGKSNKLINSQKNLTFRTGAWELHLSQLGPQNLSSHKSRTLVPILTSRTSFSQELWEQSNKIMKSQKKKKNWLWGLGPRSYIWVNWSTRLIQP